MRKAVPVPHPICFALYPVLLAYSKNVNLVQFSDILRSLFVSLAGCLALPLLFQLLLQDWRRAGLVTTWIVLLFSMSNTALACRCSKIARSSRSDGALTSMRPSIWRAWR